MKFHLTYDIVTEESSRQGDFAYNGYVTRDGNTPRKRNYIPKRPAEFTLREAIELLKDRQGSGPVEADCCPVSLESPPRWFNYGGSLDEYGESTTVSLHLPKNTTPSSRMRVAKLLHCYGVK